MALDRIMAMIGLDGSSFEVGAKRVESVSAKLGNNISSNLKGAIASTIGAAAIGAAVRNTIEFGDRIYDLSKRLGMTAEKFQELAYAFKTTGGSEQGMIGFLERLSVARDKALSGDKGTANNFKRLGVSQSDLETKGNADIMAIIGKAIQGGSVQDLIAPLRAVGGRGAGELVAGFKEGLDAKAAEFKGKGLEVGNEAIFALQQLKDESQNFAAFLTATLAPAIIWVMDKFYDMVGGLKVVGSFLGGLTSKITAGNIKKELQDPKNILFGPLAPTVILGKLMSQGVGDAMEQADKTVEDENKKRIQRSIDRVTGGVVTPDKFKATETVAPPQEAKSVNARQANVDSLQKIGGFVGVGAEMPMVNIAREQLTELKTIARNTTPQPVVSTPDNSVIDE